MAGYGHVLNVPRTIGEWKGNVKNMMQNRFPNVQVRRSGYDQGAGRWAPPLSKVVVVEERVERVSEESKIGL